MASSLVIVSGPPGSGKSTVARLLADEFEHSVLVEGDAFFAFLASGAIPPWLPESHEQNQVVTRVAASATGIFVRGGYDVVYDGVMGSWFLADFAAESGLETFEYALLLPSEDECVRRVGSRTGHGFTDADATRTMHREFVAHPIDQRHVLRDGATNPAQIVLEIQRRRKAGTLTWRAGRGTI